MTKEEALMSPEVDNSYNSEMRIGLAMSGGIALVLYQSGAAHEILRFVRSWDKSAEADSPSYKTLLEHAKIRPVLDIITGASAGGINCVLLGHCLAFNKPFSVFRNAWVETADVQKLRYSSDPKSLLNREPLIEKIRSEMKRGTANPPADLDLYTALCRTEVHGQEMHTADALGHMISVDTRANFIDFALGAYTNKNNTENLLKAGSATSAFPGAFAPVQADKRWYIDGGLWNNEPLNLAVAAVQDKPAYSLTHRYIFLVQPEPISPKIENTIPKEPSLAEILAGIPLMGLNGNIWDAVESIQRYNQRYSVYKGLLASIGTDAIKTLGANIKSEADKQVAYLTKDIVPEFPQEILAEKEEEEPEKLKEEYLRDLRENLTPLNLVRFHNVFFQNDAGLIARWNALLDQPGADKVGMNKYAIECLKAIDRVDLKLRALRREIQATNKALKEKPPTDETSKKKTKENKDSRFAHFSGEIPNWVVSLT